MPTSADIATLRVDGREYAGWTELRVTRGLDRCTSDVEIGTAERWLGQDRAWRVVPYDAVQVRLGGDTVVDGFVEAYEPEFGGTDHRVRISGRSRTADLVDCSPDIPSGQYRGYSLVSIVRAVCGLFGVAVVVDPSAADAVRESVADATIERCETAWAFLERLCRLAAVLACDTPEGALMLTRAGVARSSGALVEGGNILRARGRYDVRRRFSQYIVKGQSGVSAGAQGATASAPASYAGLARVSDGAGVLVAPKPASGTGHVQVGQHAVSVDAGVPRYRPHVTIAESQLTQAQMQLRADWQRAYAYGRSLEPVVTVAGWRQPDGRLWQVNELVSIASPRLGLDQDLLIVALSYRMDGETGATTELTLSPPEGYTPDPGEVRCRRHRTGRRGGRRGRGRSLLGLDGLASAGDDD